MKTLTYAALFAVMATSISAISANATPANDMLTNSGSSPAFRMTQNPQNNRETSVSKIKVDDTQAKTRSCPPNLGPATTGGAIRQQLEAQMRCNSSSKSSTK